MVAIDSRVGDRHESLPQCQQRKHGGAAMGDNEIGAGEIVIDARPEPEELAMPRLMAARTNLKDDVLVSSVAGRETIHRLYQGIEVRRANGDEDHRMVPL